MRVRQGRCCFHSEMARLTCKSSVPPSEQQAMEAELLESIFGKPAFLATTTGDDGLLVLRIRLPPDSADWWRVELVATLLKDHPEALPQVDVGVRTGDPAEHMCSHL